MNSPIPSLLPTHRLQTGTPAHVTILLAGCGGTGSFAALHLARLAYEARRGGLGLQLVFIDPDTVEEKNIGRQNFCPGEIGQPKAIALASRYNLAFGLQIGAMVSRFGSSDLVRTWAKQARRGTHLLLVIGCVDSPAAREEIQEAIAERLRVDRRRRDIWWLDAGNDEHSGQVLIGNSLDEQVIEAGLGCTALPLPGFQEPALVSSQMPVVSSQTEGLSCAELLALNVQSLMINQCMAGWIGVYASRLLLSRDLDFYQTWVDLRSGLARSVAVTGEAGAIGKAEPETREIGVEGGAVGMCPNCNAYIFAGRDVLDPTVGETETVFCPACGWQVPLHEYEDITQQMLDEEEALGLVEM